MRSALLGAVLVAMSGPAVAAGVRYIWNGPNQSIGDDLYLDASSLALQLSLASVNLHGLTVPARDTLVVLESVDLSVSAFGTTTGNLWMNLPTVSFLGDVVMGSGALRVSAADFSLADSSVSAPVRWDGGASGVLTVGANSLLALGGGTLGTSLTVDTNSTVSFLGHGFELDTGSGFTPVAYGALADNAGVLRGILASGESFQISFAHDAGMSSILLNPVPVPAALWLFGSGMAALGWLRRRP